jgi:hypothetical protein
VLNQRPLFISDAPFSASFSLAASGSNWPVAEIDPVRPKRRLADEALAAKVNSRAGSRRRTTGQLLPLAVHPGIFR